MKELSINALRGLACLAGAALAIFTIVTAITGFVLTVCGTVSFWSWVLGDAGFVAMCLP